uniref:SH3 domain protein n=1 Tax=Candidatus Kentrum sp. SD TaxID=2126332 RepID=A0A450YK03_9GAMM|nr:MAG: SH3 domain protein [Candidatus Kentron sp. SD]VFK47757.1 MAG: SH3 domain protein [Candidatus Kentron sp. SD]VFK78206.1 MAG: SH3 domain protein [Candidatus Kentron sp. SD]
MKYSSCNTATFFSSFGIAQWIIAAWLIFLSYPASAETAYIVDRLLAGVHEDKAQDSSVLEVLPTGAAVTIISREEDFTEARTASGTLGWIDNNYLMAEKPAQLLLMELEAEHERTKIRLEEAKTRLRELTAKDRGGDLISWLNTEFGLQFPPLPTAWKWGLAVLGLLLAFALGGYAIRRIVCCRYYLVQRTKRDDNKGHGEKTWGRKKRNGNQGEKDGAEKTRISPETGSERIDA